MVIVKNGIVTVEWPTQCTYWNDPNVVRFIESYNLGKTNIDGCAYGLQAAHGEYIRKPWTIQTNSNQILQKVNKKCDGTHDHVACRGTLCKTSELYTDSLVRVFMECFTSECT